MPKKVKVTLESGEAFIVASVEQIEHMIFTYRELAEQLDSESDKQAWRDVADQIEYWLQQTAYLEEVEDDDWN